MHFSSAALAALLAGIAASTPVVARAKNEKPVFAHYMIGEIFDDHTRTDIVDAQKIGIDGFAMNFDQFEGWSNRTVKYLFKNAEALNFKLFFSFDHNYFNDPSQYAGFVNQYKDSKAYYKHGGKALVTTFAGENVANDRWGALKKATGDIIIVPGFERAKPTENFFDGRSNIDGVFNWNSWPTQDQGKIIVSTKEDKTFQTAATNAKKLFMMGISPGQAKHLNKKDNWYRRGEDNLEYRFGQALDMQPDMLQLQSWNDAGEGHYMGNLWPEPRTISPEIQDRVSNREHTGYKEVLGPFIAAWRRGDRTTDNMVPNNGKDIQGTFWHHTLTVGATCGTAELPKSGDVTRNAEDAVSGIILVAPGKTGLVGVVNVGNKELGKLTLKPGFNKFKFAGLTPGKVQVEVWRGSTMIGGGYGKLEVKNSGAVCNYAFQVVGFPG